MTALLEIISRSPWSAHVADNYALYAIILRNFPKRQRVRKTVLVPRSANEAVLTPAPCAS
jgi:hypothetical protein